MKGKLKVGSFPFRFVGLWLFCIFGLVYADLRDGTVAQWWVIPLFTFVFLGCFYCEYNRRVTWDEQGIRQRWRGAGYLFWHLDDDFIRMEDIIAVTTDRYTNTWPTSKVFMNIEIRTADFMMYINPSYFRREEFDDLLKYIQQAHPEVTFDDDALEFVNGGFKEYFPYRFYIGEEWRKIREERRKSEDEERP